MEALRVNTRSVYFSGTFAMVKTPSFVAYGLCIVWAIRMPATDHQGVHSVFVHTDVGKEVSDVAVVPHELRKRLTTCRESERYVFSAEKQPLGLTSTLTYKQMASIDECTLRSGNVVGSNDLVQKCVRDYSEACTTRKVDAPAQECRRISYDPDQSFDRHDVMDPDFPLTMDDQFENETRPKPEHVLEDICMARVEAC